jgi:hypothetical protein
MFSLQGGEVHCIFSGGSLYLDCKKNETSEDAMDKLGGFFSNKYVIGFGIGVAASVIGYRAYKSKKLRKAVVKAVAQGIKLRDDAKHTINSIKEDAEDICAEAKENPAAAGA